MMNLDWSSNIFWFRLFLIFLGVVWSIFYITLSKTFQRTFLFGYKSIVVHLKFESQIGHSVQIDRKLPLLLAGGNCLRKISLLSSNSELHSPKYSKYSKVVSINMCL